MNKDIIYIDVEDDITAVIGKIKASKDKIIALVPPKRVGILQSAVNLRLLNRMAQTNNKRLVLITNNPALVGLSANIGIPVAKNLQSKPELPEITALDVDDGEDIIDGASLPVGEHIKFSEKADETGVAEKIGASTIASLDIDDKAVSLAEKKTDSKPASKTNSGVKVPDFSIFRKRLFLGITAGVLLVVFFVWAAIFAPSAKVIVTARTTPTGVSTVATLSGTADTDISKGLIKSVTQEIKKEVNVEFTVTGTDKVGEKAKGNVVFSNCYSSSQETIKAGTYLSNGGHNYVLKQDAVVSAGTFAGGCAVPGTSTSVSIEAAGIGSDYNVAPSGGFTVSGYPSGSSGMSAQTSDGLAGGTSREVKVPTAEDIQKATEKLTTTPEEEVRAALAGKFVNGEVVIEDSFKADAKSPVSSPKVGEETKDGTAKLTVSTTYTLVAIPKADVELYLKADLDKQLTTRPDQRVYDYGIDAVSLTEYTKKKEGDTVRIVTTGRIGPSIDETGVKDKVKGKIYGDAQAILESIDGVVNADVQFPFFWVRSVPDNNDKIAVEFKLADE